MESDESECLVYNVTRTTTWRDSFRGLANLTELT